VAVEYRPDVGRFARRELLVSMTFGVAVVPLLVHGLTMSKLLRSLGLARDSALLDRGEN